MFRLSSRSFLFSELGFRYVLQIYHLLFVSYPLQFFLRSWSDSNGTNIGAWIGGYAALSVVQLIGM